VILAMPKKDLRFDIKSISSYYLHLLPFIFICILVTRRPVQRRLFASVLFLDTHLLLWRIDPLLSKDLETNNETTAVVTQHRGKHVSTTRVTAGNGVMQPVTRQLQQLDYKNVNGDVFYVVHAEELS
jgi:hypothetical protein